MPEGSRRIADVVNRETAGRNAQEDSHWQAPERVVTAEEATQLAARVAERAKRSSRWGTSILARIEETALAGVAAVTFLTACGQEVAPPVSFKPPGIVERVLYFTEREKQLESKLREWREYQKTRGVDKYDIDFKIGGLDENGTYKIIHEYPRDVVVERYGEIPRMRRLRSREVEEVRSRVRRLRDGTVEEVPIERNFGRYAVRQYFEQPLTVRGGENSGKIDSLPPEAYVVGDLLIGEGADLRNLEYVSGNLRLESTVNINSLNLSPDLRIGGDIYINDDGNSDFDPNSNFLQFPEGISLGGRIIVVKERFTNGEFIGYVYNNFNDYNDWCKSRQDG